jgi:hypothetical protein
MHVAVYTKNCHILTIFRTYLSFMHHGEYLENNFQWNFVIDDSLYPNVTLCCEMNTHMNDIIVQQCIILICKALKHFCDSNIKVKKCNI